MPPNPSLTSFLLRSRSLWLCAFLITFLAWAWHDSMDYRTTFSYSRENFSCMIESQVGGLRSSFYDPNPFIPSGFWMWRDARNYADPDLVSDVRTLFFEIDPPDIQYSTLMIVAALATTSWITWRWRKTVAEASRLPAFFI